MIVVTLTQSGLTVDGHAGYAETGNDIICAAISALAQGLLHSLDALIEDSVSSEIANGHIALKWENLSEQGKLLIDSFFSCRERHPVDLWRSVRKNSSGAGRAENGMRRKSHEIQKHEKEVLDNAFTAVCWRWW